ncbi:MAG TPA: 3-deoxy-D-manno-octulosonic acid transferase [Syntrophales bacterium]|nr:3-deoxy-D-manno-octulosonic acid transferase [Syntrophales bacterium]
MFVLYNILLLIAALLALPYYALKMMLTGKYRKSLGPKFGIMSKKIFDEMKGSPRIWIHAVSVGEVTVAAPVVAYLRIYFRGACIVVSTSTETGQEMARRIVAGATSFIYYPLDVPWVVKKVINQVRPDIFIMTETELWPNFIRICKENNVKVILVNGRISPRSFKKYAATRFFWRSILNDIDEAGVISEIDAVRLNALGIPSTRIHVMGNAKYDSLAAKASPALQEEIAGTLNLKKDERVLVAGSTHEGEEKIIIEVYRGLLAAYPDSKLIIVPRHPERGQAVVDLAKESGFGDCITMTAIIGGRRRTDERVIIIDVIGELFKIYSMAAVVFCGGSLVPKGGQNILEPAAWGKVVFYGPYMDDFRDEMKLLEETGAGIQVESGRQLLSHILELMRDPDAIAKRGEEGREMILANMGAAERYATLIKKHLVKS